MYEFLRNFIGDLKLRRFPWFLFIAAVLLCGLGAIFIASAASFHYAKRHLIFSVIGVIVFLFAIIPDYRHLPVLAVPFYVIGLSSLILLRFYGIEVNHARRWFSLGPINFQPSELMKLFLVIALATYFSYRTRIDRFRDILLPIAITLAPVFFILIQPDLGTCLVLVALFMVVAFLGGIQWRKLLTLIIIGIALLAAAWYTPGVLRPYQKQRLTSFINPAAAPHSPAAYNARQATLAIAGGGWFGQGWGQGRLTQLKRIPERHTDFIFPVIAEEWGYLLTAAFVAYYFFIVFLLWKMTRDTNETFARLLMGGITGLFAIQGTMHMAISLRLAPITGLTLPLVSYGGSSLVTVMAAFGLAANAYMRHDQFSDLS